MHNTEADLAAHKPFSRATDSLEGRNFTQVFASLHSRVHITSSGDSGPAVAQHGGVGLMAERADGNISFRSALLGEVAAGHLWPGLARIPDEVDQARFGILEDLIALARAAPLRDEIGYELQILHTAKSIRDSEARIIDENSLVVRTEVFDRREGLDRVRSIRMVGPRMPEPAELRDALCELRTLPHEDSADEALHRCGHGPAVFAPAAGAAFFHELLGHALEEDNFVRDNAYVHALKTWHGPLGLTVIDDPGLGDGYGRLTADDDGVVAAIRPIVDAGRIGLPLRAKRLRTQLRPEAGGSGRRAHFGFPALPRSTNTVVVDGADSAADVYAPTAAGVLFAADLAAGEVDPRTGEFEAIFRRCWVLGLDSRTFLGTVRVHGDAVATLSSLSAVGEDPRTDSISCGKSGQWVGVGLRSPSLRFEDVTWHRISI